jgi:hypothetical protein
MLNLAPALSAHLVAPERLEERLGYLPTGIAALDDLLGGGWPRGGLVELEGRRSSGRTAVLLASLAAALAVGQATALIDAEGALDPRGAAAAGVALERLLWVRAGGRDALKAADLLIGAGGFGLVALDLGDGRAAGRGAAGAPTGIPSAAWLRLKHAAARQGTTVLVAAPRRTVGAFASAAVQLAARAPRFDGGGPPLLTAIETSVEVLRRSNRSPHPSGSAPATARLLVRLPDEPRE